MTATYWHALLYLLPSAVVAFGLIRLSRHMYLFSFLTLSGTLVHEGLHLVCGMLLGARPTSMNVWPRKTPSGYMMGHVAFSNVHWWNAAPVALAPMLIAPLIFGVAYWRVSDGWHFDPMQDVVLWIALAPQLLSCWPSGTDWRLAMRSWPLLLLGCGAVWLLWGQQIEGFVAK